MGLGIHGSTVIAKANPIKHTRASCEKENVFFIIKKQKKINFIFPSKTLDYVVPKIDGVLCNISKYLKSQGYLFLYAI